MNLQPIPWQNRSSNPQSGIVKPRRRLPSEPRPPAVWADAHLDRPPFPTVPDTRCYFPGERYEEVRRQLVELVERQSGPAIVVGRTGLGKSLLCHLLAESFRQRRRVVLLPTGRLNSRRALFQAVLHGLGLPYRGGDETELRLSLLDHLSNPDLCPAGVLLLIDDAQLAHPAILEEVGVMTNWMEANRPLVQPILFGNTSLEEKLVSPRLEFVQQRLAGRFYLEPFPASETEEYLRFQITDAGASAELFPKTACEQIHRATDGIPRLINQLADQAMTLVNQQGRDVVTAEDVETAWAQLQQLPGPTDRRSDPHSHAPPGEEDDVVEFGPLDDDETSDLVQLPARQAESDSLEPVEPRALPESPLPTDHISKHSLAKLPEPIVPTRPVLYEQPRDENPFAESFETEEPIHDPFAALDQLAQRSSRVVRCQESNLLAQQLDQLHDVGQQEPVSLDTFSLIAAPTDGVHADAVSSSQVVVPCLAPTDSAGESYFCLADFPPLPQVTGRDKQDSSSSGQRSTAPDLSNLFVSMGKHHQP